MTKDIVDIFKTYISSLGFVGKIGGLVKPITFQNTNDAGQTVTKKIPVACDVTHTQCISGKYEALVPDNRYKSLIYFEEISGASMIDMSPKDFTFQSKIRLVCWLNLKKLGKTECSISSLALTNILSALPGGFVNNGIYHKIRFVLIGQVLKDPSIFSKYTYNEEITQYLMYPFDYFALDFNVNYTISRSCITPWSNDTEITCEDHTQ